MLRWGRGAARTRRWDRNGLRSSVFWRAGKEADV